MTNEQIEKLEIDSPMKVSIIIPCYNQAEYLKEAIDSAKAQTIPCEIIVVDDGSTDNSLEVAISNTPSMIIQKTNGGVASARNAGIKEAKGEYILTLDADDKITPDFVEKCLEANNDIVGTWQQEFGASDRIWEFRDKPIHNEFLKNNQINCCSLFKKEIWEKIGGYDENMPHQGYEDWDFWLRATKAGYKVTVIPEILFFYRKHGDSMITNTVKHHNELLNYMLKKL